MKHGGVIGTVGKLRGRVRMADYREAVSYSQCEHGQMEILRVGIVLCTGTEIDFGFKGCGYLQSDPTCE